MKLLVVCDLDGTLLNKSSSVSENTKLFFKNFIKEGNELVIATGRSYSGAIKIYNELELKTPLICDNGGFIINPTDESFKPIVKSMPLALFHELFWEFKDKVASALFNRGEQVYTYKYIKEFEWLINNTTSENIIEETFDKLTIAPSGLMLLVHNADFFDLDNLIHTKYKDFLFTRNWGRDRKYTIYEICAIDAHKSAAAEYVIEYLGIDRKNSICFGDGINDLELIRDAYFGVAMKNAYLEVKDVSDAITEFNNEHDGVVEYLKEYLKKLE